MKGITESRLLKEKKVNANGYETFYIQPLPSNLYEWHFTMKGPKGSVYEGGLYHGYFQIPKDYPLAPPNIYFMNKSGRYEINKKICMNITSYHKEEWTPAWTLRTMMQAISAHFVGRESGQFNRSRGQRYRQSQRLIQEPQTNGLG